MQWNAFQNDARSNKVMAQSCIIVFKMETKRGVKDN